MLKEISGGPLARHINAVTDTAVNALTGACTGSRTPSPMGCSTRCRRSWPTVPGGRWRSSFSPSPTSLGAGGRWPSARCARRSSSRHRVVKRRDGHADHDPGRHGGGDHGRRRDPRGRHGRRRRVDVIVRPFLDGFQAIPAFVYLVARRWPCSRRPASPPSSRRWRIAVPDRDEAGRRRHPRGLADAVEAPLNGKRRLADDLEGALSDGAQSPGAGDQPGSALCPVHGRDRRHGRAHGSLDIIVQGFSRGSC